MALTIVKRGGYMKTLNPVIVAELEAGRCAALATVLQAKGSAPRGAGACLLLLADGSSAGTVGGGVLEHRALTELAALMQATYAPCETAEPAPVTVTDIVCDSPSQAQEYALTQDDVKNLGMVCGGNVTLLYQLLTPSMLPLFRYAHTKMNADENLYLIRELSAGQVRHMAFTKGDTNTTWLSKTDITALCSRKPVWQDMSNAGEWTGYFVEPVRLRTHAYLFGCGHVSQRVAPLLTQLDFSPIVYDDRPEFACAELFPAVSGILCAPFGEAAKRLSITNEDEIVIMTRGHTNDSEILAFALRTPAYYIGLIGSRSKIAHTKALMISLGFTEADFARVHTPIGLPIMAETPMEIAVSVAAEMILVRAKHDA
jgi:xanthine dehydrogenase accessory factor